MARKRMIDPKIWDTAYDKHWTTDDLAVMLAAISAADDEGYGRISLIKRNVSEMISEKKFQKSLRNLEDSIQIYDQIYFFLPNFLEYQTINHPKPSVIPKPKAKENNSLAQNNTVMNTVTPTVFGDVSKDKIREVKLSKGKDASTKKTEPGIAAQDFEQPTLSQVKLVFANQGLPQVEAEKFWSHYDKLGWVNTRGQPIKNWISGIIGWMNNSKQFSEERKNNGTSSNENAASIKSRLGYKPDPSKYEQRIRELKQITGES